MKNILFAVLFVMALGMAYADQPQEMTQVSTIDLLSRGQYKGIYTIKEMRPYGDFGLGTFDGLDGEMVVLDGQFYQVTSDGHVHVAEDAMTVPFLTVTFFKSTQTFAIKDHMDEKQFGTYLQGLLPDKNVFYAIKVKGKFQVLKLRSVPKQKLPYPPLSEVVKNQQQIFDMSEVEGTMVGFWCPSYAAGMNVPGIHLHFLTDDHKAGGHVLGFTIDQATLDIDEIEKFRAFLEPISHK